LSFEVDHQHIIAEMERAVLVPDPFLNPVGMREVTQLALVPVRKGAVAGKNGILLRDDQGIISGTDRVDVRHFDQCFRHRVQFLRRKRRTDPVRVGRLGHTRRPEPPVMGRIVFLLPLKQ